MGVFQDEYAKSFNRADRVYLSAVDRPEKAPEGDRLDLERLRKDVGAEKAGVYGGPGEIAEALTGGLREGDVIVLMSNGGFGGLPALLESALKERAS